MSMNDEKNSQKKLQRIKCPRCRGWTTWQDNPHRPFCSAKCRQVDLGKWAQEEYAIPGEYVPRPEEEE